MKYSYRYAPVAQRLSGRSRGGMEINDDHLAETQIELMNRLDDPNRNVIVVTEIDAPIERVWEIAASSVETFLSYQPGFVGLVQLNSLESQEGGRFVVQRVRNGGIVDRMGEVLVNLPLSQLTVSDLDCADTSVAGSFPSLFTVKVEQSDENLGHTMLRLEYTMLGIPRPMAALILAHQAGSIKEMAERKVLGA